MSNALIAIPPTVDADTRELEYGFSGIREYEYGSEE
jgi:hypothetical protein